MTRNKIIFGAFALIALDAHGALNSFLKPASFPKTIGDTTFTQRVESAQKGYEPYAGLSAFDKITLESEETYLLRNAENQRRRDLSSMSNAQYCAKYPLDSEYCPQTPEKYEQVIAIGNRQSEPTSGTSTTPAQTIANATTRPSPTQPSPTQTPSYAPTTPMAPLVGYSEFNEPVYANPKTHNGPCTLPQRHDVFSNQIFTSGQYAKSDPAFEKTMITTFRAEGGCVNDPDDSGGYTCYGISQNNNPDVNVRNITRADAEQIAHRKYYTQYGIEKLPDYIRSDVFTFGWGCGPVTGIHKLCRVLGLPERNKIDDEIVNAVENYSGDLHNDYVDALQQHYIAVSKKNNNQKYLNGWMNRVKLTRENSCHYKTTTPIKR